MFLRVSALVLFLVSTSLFAQEFDSAFLDPAYKNHTHPSKSNLLATDKTILPLLSKPPIRSDIKALIASQSPVKSQISRGTCSIFSATAMLEAMLIKQYGFSTTTDLSEEWLEYLITRRKASEGSSSYSNFRAFINWGSAEESLLPYIGYEWKLIEAGTLSEARCGHLANANEFSLKACLLGHRDPDLLDLSDAELETKDSELLVARKNAAELRDQYIKINQHDFIVSNVNSIKSLLASGTPVTLDMDFYYGAWNHRKTVELGIPRNLDHWNKGIVGYPLKESVDSIQTKTDPAGHSILVVGYDDSVEVELEHLMPDGTLIKNKYIGVYYFKNSWGTAGFGIDFTLDGINYPGYGMIVQDYAHEYGTFYKLPL